ncbi:hypothetical protein GCM10022226_40460 [Sphaerisporangium flaviroseum]|uniref:Lysylphosphatidylglycerol synthetase family protein n=1 Tax=Sphaerisporangium flaviroseum TaxID=509199 RepID=A0ABP7ID71_9ACTN
MRAACYLVVLGFLGYQMWRVRHGLGASLRLVGWGNALLAGVLAAVGGVPGFFGWRMLLAAMGTRLTHAAALRVFFLAGLTRYLPGGVWPAVAHAASARALGEPPARLAGAFVASQGLGVISGLAVGLLALPWLVAADAIWWALLPVLAAALVPLAAPRLLSGLLSLAQRVLRRDSPPTTPPKHPPTQPERPPAQPGRASDLAGRSFVLPGRRVLFVVTGVMALGWLVSGTHIAVLAIALGAPPGGAMTVGIGGFALAAVAGIFTLVMPSGLGGRELVLGLTLATQLSGSGLVTLVALSRVLITVGEMASAVAVLGLLAWIGRASARTVGHRPPRSDP